MAKWNVGLLAFGVLSVTSAVGAAPAFTAGKATVNARLQYGVNLEDGDANPYKLGLALGGGYTLSNNLFIGGNFDYFFGEKVDINLLGVTGNVSINVWQLMGNVGYDLGLTENLVLRPYGGLGLASIGGKSCMSMAGFGEQCTSSSDMYAAMALGAQPLLAIGPAFLLADARFNIIFGDETAKALFFGAGGGAHF